MIGVLGGMGPAATVDFMAKLIRLTPAGREQDHLPLVVVSDPRVPDRVAPILRGPRRFAAAGDARRHPAPRAGRGGLRRDPLPHRARLVRAAGGGHRAADPAHRRCRARRARSGSPCPRARSACSRPRRRSRPGSTRSAWRPPAIRRCSPRPRSWRVRAAGDRPGQAGPRRGGGTAARARGRASGRRRRRARPARLHRAAAGLAAAPHPACIDATEALARSCLAWWRRRQR